jgi:murein DD-endopeptidase MepM/ murein hydrolase activator NlpD
MAAWLLYQRCRDQTHNTTRLERNPTMTLNIFVHRILLTSTACAAMLSACAQESELESAEQVPDSNVVISELAPIDLESENPDAAQASEMRARVAAGSQSQGYYSFPYEAGTTVHVTNDADSHTPANRIDMSGTSGGPYKVVAAAPGEVMFVQDSHNVNGGCENNNYVWIKHSNGEWSKYSHVAYHSASVNAGIEVGDWVDAGQFIGIESDIGCASGDHVHFEIAVPNDLSDPINPVGGYIKGVNLVPKVCGISGQTFVAGQNYVVPDVRPGASEYARHGLADGDFQEVFNAATNCGYELVWNDGFDQNGTATFNPVFKPRTPGVSTLSHRRLTEDQLDAKIDSYVDESGYSLVHIDAYNVGSLVRYAAIFKKGASIPQTTTYHGLSAAQHQNSFNALTGAGWRPRVVSVAGVGTQRTYAGVYTQGSIGSYMVRSFQTAADYQTNYTDNKDAGRRLIYLNSYVYDGEPRYTAIWASSAETNVFARHGMSSASYQSYWNSRTSAGWDTAAVSGIQTGGVTRYAAYWTK